MGVLCISYICGTGLDDWRVVVRTEFLVVLGSIGHVLSISMPCFTD
jgi:hypothetical protein